MCDLIQHLFYIYLTLNILHLNSLWQLDVHKVCASRFLPIYTGCASALTTAVLKVTCMSWKFPSTGLRRRVSCIYIFFASSLRLTQFVTSSFARPNLLINEFDGHLLALHTGCAPFKVGVILFHFSLPKKRLLMGFTRETSPGGIYRVTFSSQTTRRWADERHRKQDALEQPSSPWTISFPRVLFPDRKWW